MHNHPKLCQKSIASEAVIILTLIRGRSGIDDSNLASVRSVEAFIESCRVYQSIAYHKAFVKLSD